MKVLIAICLIAIAIREWPKGYGRVFLSNGKSLSPRNLPFEGIALLAFIAVTYLFDATVLRTIQSVDSPVGTGLIQFGGTIGRNINFWFAIIFAYCAAQCFSLKKCKTILCGLMLSSALTGACCAIGKIVFLRARPAAGIGPVSFFNLDGYIVQKGLFLSFPSGDVALVAGGAAFLFYFVQNKGLKFLLLALPFLTGASRVYLNRHWPSDTLLAIGIGFIVAHYLFTVHCNFVRENGEEFEPAISDPVGSLKRSFRQVQAVFA
jgi:membrane-associated phospholipid phosphatase